MGVRSSMAREPTTIIEAFACHPSAIVEVRVPGKYSASMNWTWHGACVAAGESVLVDVAKRHFEAAVFVHDHSRDYLTDCRIAHENDQCAHCRTQLRYLPAGKSYE